MNRLLSILLLCCIYSHLYAQTPYDAFAPEVSSPILDVVQDIEYEYDYVGNISRINQYASSCNGLGGAYVNEYFYDEQYRLVESIGTGDFQYNVIATYSPSGRLGNKYTALSSPSLPNMSDVYFGYDDQHLTHQPRTLYDIMSGGMNLYWDANGNIAEMIHCEQDARRFHEWDVKRNSRTEKSPVDSSRSKCGARVCQSKHRTQLDRLRFVLGESFAGYYGYDANGERVYKLTGTCGIDQINHNGTRAYVMFDDAVLYPNPYLVVTPRGYTKHYYAGTERLATAIGSGGFDDMGLTIGHYDSREEDIAQMFYANYQNEDPFYYDHILSEMIGTSTIEGDNMPELEYRREPIILGRVDVIGGENLLYSSIEDNLPVRDRERELFFSHSDHLGSANWITDYDGVPIQYLHYAPYGELIDNQHASGSWYDERYKFTGKERDWETGYDYFGARYWWLAGTWLSVDPLSDKYPNISPYAYCMWNPVKYVDPDGRDVTLAGANRSSVTIRTDLINLNVNISNLNVDFGGTYNFQGDEILSASLDIAGIFDPSGVADGLNAALQWNNGDVSGAFISAAGLVPYFGDIAKAGKVKKDLGVINNAIEAANKGKKELVYVGTKENRRAVPVPDGFKKIKERTRNGQPIFQQGKKYFSPDRDSHNGGVWKRADSPKALESKTTRDGTYDENLQRIGD